MLMEEQNSFNQQAGANDAPVQQDNPLNASVSEPMSESTPVVPVVTSATTDASIKKIKILAIVLGALTLIFAAIALFFGISYVGNKPTNNPNANNNGSTTTPDENNGTSTGTTTPEYKGVKDLMMNIMSSFDNFGGEIRGDNMFNLSYKFDGTETFMPLENVLEASISTSNAGNTVSVMSANLADAGFSAIGEIPFMGSAGPILEGYYNANINVVCGIFDDDTEVYLDCAEANWSWLTDEEKTLAKSLITAYYNKTGEYPIKLHPGGKIIDGADSHQRITVGMNGGRGEFYRVSPTAEWQFFYGGQDYASCSEYNTEDLKKAFFGAICRDDSGESTVHL